MPGNTQQLDELGCISNLSMTTKNFTHTRNTHTERPKGRFIYVVFTFGENDLADNQSQALSDKND